MSQQDAAPQVGDRSSYTTEPVTTRQIVMYAGASGDFNPIHYDQSFAESAGLGGVIAHGMLHGKVEAMPRIPTHTWAHRQDAK